MSEAQGTGSQQQSAQKNNPLHGVTLKQVVTELEAEYGWQELASRIDIRCFKSDPSIKSSLKFLRQTPWAREKVEGLWIRLQESKKIWGSPVE
ncbi:VF530 family protein [Amphritea sp.]|uniref:VF530 family protein n=1 Tax=Amphritea sp. TaxID=1872502 RepID=UPI0025B8EC59|nr:VF530 family protein [Amphritea sp.]